MRPRAPDSNPEASMLRGGATNFDEVVALLQRNEPSRSADDQSADQRDARDLEYDLQRLLLLTRDATLRDQMIQAQAVRRIAAISKNQTGGSIQHYCAAILCNLAQSERGRLSASSCDRWFCVSHRHNCPLAMLLAKATSPSPDTKLRELSAAALLSFTVQNECQLQLDLIGVIPMLLRILHDTRDDGEQRVFVAAALWNLTKSPLLLLKLETTHGVLKDQLARKLTDTLWTSVESFQLSATPTEERGSRGLLECDSVENLGVMLAASVSAQLSIVLRVENYVGRPRSFADQYRAKTPLHGGRGSRDPSGVMKGKSAAHFDESGVLKSRTCAVCGKAIKLRKKRRKPDALPYLVCAKDGCEQTFHVACSRWKTLTDERRLQHSAEFFCATCVSHVSGVKYCDFLAENLQHEQLISEIRFKSVAVQRVQSMAGSGTNQLYHSDGVAYAALLDTHTSQVVAIGVKKFRIASSSQDPEMFVVSVRYIRLTVCPATQQQPAQHRVKTSASGGTTDPAPVVVKGDWNLSYASEGAMQIPLVPGSTVFWPGRLLQDLDGSLYTQRSLSELRAACLYEFQGETPVDKMFSFGTSLPLLSGQASAQAPLRLWSTLYPRRGICMKLLAEQIGQHKQLHELLGEAHSRNSSNSSSSSGTGLVTPEPTKKQTRRKPHIVGRKLNKVAVVNVVT